MLNRIRAHLRHLKKAPRGTISPAGETSLKLDVLILAKIKKDPLITCHRRHRPISGQHHTAVADIANKLCIYLLQPQIASSILCLVVLASSNLIFFYLAFSILLPLLSFFLNLSSPPLTVGSYTLSLLAVNKETLSKL